MRRTMNLFELMFNDLSKRAEKRIDDDSCVLILQPHKNKNIPHVQY